MVLSAPARWALGWAALPPLADNWEIAQESGCSSSAAGASSAAGSAGGSFEAAYRSAEQAAD